MEDTIDTSGYNMCEPTDVHPSVKHYELMKWALLYSDKPPRGSPYGEDRARVSVEMAGIANDDPDLTKPYVSTTVNTVSPRTLDAKMLGGLLVYARPGQPIMASPGVMSAASGPSTVAGTLVLANAEALAELTIAQLVNEGTPVIYGGPTSNIDVRYGSFAIGSPEGALCVAATAQLARYYDVPSRAGGALTDAKTVSDQSGSEAMFQLLTSFNSGINYVHHAAGILDSYSTVSPEKFVLDADRIRIIERFRRGFDISEDTLAKDLIGEVEPGGHYLNKRHTLEHSREDHLFPEVTYRDSYDNWEAEGAKRPFELAHERVQMLLDEYERPPIDDDIRADLERYVDEGKTETLAD
jgi:trimethylamine--corrinoid protein Co-methyltransferase